MHGHKKIREMTGDSAQLKEDKVAFLVLAKYSNAAFSLLPVLGILSQSRNSGRSAQQSYMAVTHGITLTQDPRQAGKFSKSGERIYPKQEVWFRSSIFIPDFICIPHFLLQAESHTQLCAVTFQLSQHQPRGEQAAPEICKNWTFKGQSPLNTVNVAVGFEWELLQAPWA